MIDVAHDGDHGGAAHACRSSIFGLGDFVRGFFFVADVAGDGAESARQFLGQLDVERLVDGGEDLLVDQTLAITWLALMPIFSESSLTVMPSEMVISLFVATTSASWRRKDGWRRPSRSSLRGPAERGLEAWRRSGAVWEPWKVRPSATALPWGACRGRAYRGAGRIHRRGPGRPGPGPRAYLGQALRTGRGAGVRDKWVARERG